MLKNSLFFKKRVLFCCFKTKETCFLKRTFVLKQAHITRSFRQQITTAGLLTCSLPSTIQCCHCKLCLTVARLSAEILPTWHTCHFLLVLFEENQVRSYMRLWSYDSNRSPQNCCNHLTSTLRWVVTVEYGKNRFSSKYQIGANCLIWFEMKNSTTLLVVYVSLCPVLVILSSSCRQTSYTRCVAWRLFSSMCVRQTTCSTRRSSPFLSPTSWDLFQVSAFRVYTCAQTLQPYVFNPLTPTVAIWIQRPIKHPVPGRVKPSFVIFDIWALWRSGLSVRVPRCQKLQTTA